MQEIFIAKKPATKSHWLKISMVGMTGFEPAASSSRTKRATKLCHIPQSQEILYGYNSFLSTFFYKFFTVLLAMVLEEVFNAAQSLGNLVDGRGIGAAYMTFTAGTEGAAGDESYMLVVSNFSANSSEV